MSQADATPIALETLKLWGKIITPPQSLITADDLAQIPDDGERHELMRGRLIKMPPPQDEQGNVQAQLATALINFCDQHNINGRVRVETGYLISATDQPDTVLGPDVSYIVPGHKGERASAYERIAPDLVVEVASPSQFRPEMSQKARLYLHAGTKLVWVIWPNSQTVEVWETDQPTGNVVSHTRGESSPFNNLDGVDVLPNFTYPIKNLFR